MKRILLSVLALLVLAVAFVVQVTAAPHAELTRGLLPKAQAHNPLCTQSGFTQRDCIVIKNGKYFTGWIGFTSPMDYPQDAYNQNPTCDCIPLPLPPGAQLCYPRDRAPHALDQCYTGSTGATTCQLYCGDVPGLHLHTKP
jgi:hypothetical protein